MEELQRLYQEHMEQKAKELEEVEKKKEKFQEEKHLRESLPKINQPLRIETLQQLQEVFQNAASLIEPQNWKEGKLHLDLSDVIFKNEIQKEFGKNPCYGLKAVFPTWYFRGDNPKLEEKNSLRRGPLRSQIQLIKISDSRQKPFPKEPQLSFFQKRRLVKELLIPANEELEDLAQDISGSQKYVELPYVYEPFRSVSGEENGEFDLLGGEGREQGKLILFEDGMVYEIGKYWWLMIREEGIDLTLEVERAKLSVRLAYIGNTNTEKKQE